MKRAHRTFHKGLWLLTALALAAILWAANSSKSGAPINQALPVTTDQGDQ